MSTTGKYIETGSGFVVAEGLGMGKQGVTAIGNEISFWGDENVLQLDSGDGCTTLNILKTTESL